MSLPVSYEYRDVAFRAEQTAVSKLSLAEIDSLLDRMERLAEPVDILEQHRPLSLDPDDDLILELAINGRADTIVTNNIRHLRAPAGRFGIEVVNAGTLLMKLKGA